MKIKPRKAIAKRFKVTGKGKVIARTAHQDHFNARESGNVTREKRLDKKITSKLRRHILSQLGLM